MGVEQIVLFGVPAAVLCALIVQVLKQLFPGLKEDDRAQIAVVLGVGLLLSVLSYLSGIVPAIRTGVEVVIGGLLVALTAMGMYDTQKAARKQ